MHEVPTFGKELKRLKDQVHAKKKKKKKTLVLWMGIKEKYRIFSFSEFCRLSVNNLIILNRK